MQRRHVRRESALIGLLIGLLAAITSASEDPRVAFLVLNAPAGVLDAESDEAAEIAQRLGATTVLTVTNDGRIIDREGHEAALERFEAV